LNKCTRQFKIFTGTADEDTVYPYTP